MWEKREDFLGQASVTLEEGGDVTGGGGAEGEGQRGRVEHATCWIPAAVW